MSGAGQPNLATRFRRLIRIDGPMPVARFMGESNSLYYASRDPMGASGDFVTAPEISQMFGEIIGLWLADVWQRAGAPGDAAYVELGPGRGTLTQDALRAMAQHGLEPEVYLVEGSPALREAQARAVPQARFPDDVASLPEHRPLMLVANEFLDALPIRQLVKTQSGWRERMVGLDGDSFVFVAGANPMDGAVPERFADCADGTVIETCPGAAALVEDVAMRLANQGGAALFIDYGRLEARSGSTLQAVRAHKKVDALVMPGEADLTAHVDFEMLAAIAGQSGLTVQIATQGEWLGAMGIGLRAQALSRSQPARRNEIAAAHDRLVSPEEMGELFKVMGLTGGGWPPGAGFGA
ncbi:MAG: class I SAM-dependent methyltransferase [Qipengyuania sp.]